jgi:hypothetical protein
MNRWLDKIRDMVADARGFHKDYLEGTTSVMDIANRVYAKKVKKKQKRK